MGERENNKSQATTVCTVISHDCHYRSLQVRKSYLQIICRSIVLDKYRLILRGRLIRGATYTSIYDYMRYASMQHVFSHFTQPSLRTVTWILHCLRTVKYLYHHHSFYFQFLLTCLLFQSYSSSGQFLYGLMKQVFTGQVDLPVSQTRASKHWIKWTE